MAQIVFDVQHRQHAEGLRDALHLWLTANLPLLGAAHPMVVQLSAWRDELTASFVA